MGSLLILAYCSDQTGARTLQDVLEGVYGRPGLIVCSTAVALYCFGTCITFLIIIGDQFDRGNENHTPLPYRIHPDPPQRQKMQTDRKI
jgi:amino acid permease